MAGASGPDDEGSNCGSKAKCDVCKNEVAKYRCPGCNMRTCCLQCVNSHKEKFSCTGTRNKTKFVSLEQFDDMTLLSDYRLLEETAMVVDNALRYPIPRGIPTRIFMPNWKRRLVKECQQRQINIMVMPPNFERRRNNKTIIVKKNILWCVEWIFNGDLKFRDSKIQEGDELGTAVNKYFEAETGSEITKLSAYREVGISGSVPLMKKEKIKGPKPKYIKLDWAKSLSENLRGTTIIEFPTIHVVLVDQLPNYDVLECMNSITV